MSSTPKSKAHINSYWNPDVKNCECFLVSMGWWLAQHMQIWDVTSFNPTSLFTQMDVQVSMKDCS